MRKSALGSLLGSGGDEGKHPGHIKQGLLFAFLLILNDRVSLSPGQLASESLSK